jgi:hypothetical protein
MNINKLSNDVTYYNNLVSTFAEERNMLNDAGIWSVRGLLTHLDDTEHLWVDGVGEKSMHGEPWVSNKEISEKRTYETQLSKFNRLINDCIDEYKKSHLITKETAPVYAKSVNRYNKGHNLATHSEDNVDGYTAIFYLNNDYVGGQISFTKKIDTSIDPLLHPKYPQNIDQIDFWIKPENFSVLIFPSSHKRTEHVITSWDRYTISVGF